MTASGTGCHRVKELAPGAGLLVLAGAAVSLLDLEPELVKAWVEEAGAVLLRGFEADRVSLGAFAQRFLSPLQLLRPEDLTERDQVQAVDAGEYSIPYHAEHGSTPLRPDLLWFLCRTPPTTDGQTLLCDGSAVWRRLRRDTRRLFESHRLRFRVRLPISMGRVFLSALRDEQRRPLLCKLSAECRHLVDEQGLVSLDYVVSAIPHRRDGMPAFANALIPQFRLGSVTFEDGSRISPEVIREIEVVADGETSFIAWQHRDVLMVDNARMMHGRRAFRGPREILTTFGLANF